MRLATQQGLHSEKTRLFKGLQRLSTKFVDKLLKTMFIVFFAKALSIVFANCLKFRQHIISIISIS